MTVPTIPEARRLVSDVKQLGGTAPPALTQLLDLVESVKSTPAVPDPVGGLVDAAAAGKAGTAAELTKLVERAAKAELEAEYFKRLQAGIARDVSKRFAAELRGGAADQIIDSLRPAFDDVAGQIAAATSIIDISWSPEQLVAEGDPEQLTAYRLLPDLVARADRIVALVSSFGPRGSLAILDEPGHLVQLRGLRDEALWVTDIDPWRASEIIRARMADWRTSFLLRLPLRLNSVAEAAERLREFAEAEWQAVEDGRGESGRLTDNGYVPDPKRPNPFARTEPDVADVVELEKV
jgi:hypothetical protein